MNHTSLTTNRVQLTTDGYHFFVGTLEATFHAADKRIQQEAREPRPHGRLYFMHYNFCRVHKTLRVTPALEAGLTDHVWSLEELVGLLDVQKREAAA